MEILAAFIGIIVAMPLGIWVMRWSWKNSSDGYFDKPFEDRQKWQEERKADVFMNIIILKFLAKGGALALVLFVLNLWYRK